MNLTVKPRDEDDLSLGYDVYDGDVCIGSFPSKEAADEFVEAEEIRAAKEAAPAGPNRP